MNLLIEGAYIGKIQELLSEDEYLYFIEKSKIVRDLIQSKRDSLSCKYDYDHRKDGEDHSISLDMISERDEYVKKNNFEVEQKWYFLNDGELPNEYFRDLTVLITKKHYL
jgi:hypothetical protein